MKCHPLDISLFNLIIEIFIQLYKFRLSSYRIGVVIITIYYPILYNLGGKIVFFHITFHSDVINYS